MTEDTPAPTVCPYRLQLEDAILRLQDSQAALRVVSEAVATRYHEVCQFAEKFREANPGTPLPDGAASIIVDFDRKAFRRGQLNMQHRAAEAVLKTAGPGCSPELHAKLDQAGLAVMALELVP